METNIRNLRELYDMHLHTANITDQMLSNWLPYGYAKDAQTKLAEEERHVSTTYIRQVKTYKKADLQILNVLIELANSNKAVAEARKAKFNKLISN